MKIKTVILLACAAMLSCLSGCASAKKIEAPGAASADPPQDTTVAEAVTLGTDSLSLTIGDTPVEVIWEDSESVEALRALVKGEALTIQMSMYGGFEQVGSLGTSLPRNDVQTATQPGDIVLYSGNQIVLFYGPNTWAYTKLGRITDKSAPEMETLLGGGDVTITLAWK